MQALLRAILAIVASLLGLLAVLPVLAVALPLALVSGATRLVRSLLRTAEPRVVPWKALVEFEPEVGWKPRPNLDAWGEADGPFRLTTDADGWRGRGRLDDADVVVFGDSFAFGHGIDDDAFFGAQAPGLAVKCVGANGYSLVQGVLWMERLAPRLGGKLVVWLVYYGNDLYENLQPNLDRYRMPFVRQRGSGWEIVTEHVRPEPWTATGRRGYYERLAELCATSFLAERAYAASGWLFGRALEITARAEARLAIVGIPDVSQIDPARAEPLLLHGRKLSGFDPKRPDRELARQAEALDIPFRTAGEILEGADHMARDVHWNASGHRKIGALLAELHRAPARSAPAAEPDLRPTRSRA